MEFVDNAAKLELFTYQHCGRFPKRYRFTLEIEIIHFASDVYMSFQSWRAYAKNFDAHNSIRQLEGLFYRVYGVISKEAARLN